MDPKHERREEQLTNDPFCSANPINHRGGRWKKLHVLEPTDMEYITVGKQFKDGWKHPHKTEPCVKAIFKIVSPSHFLVAYYQYQDRILQDLSPPMQFSAN
ncbi:hypothetical protein AGABI2DRAFT_177495, partial [Agaricus bisporus var. bisporus H97]|uniref:hypothetical protein n=1 Tax=Agaricus bisporus var. bisporus (strain H97 / ATCC MYA-4626 / FGSC 10389) TaxID=936046 RepID=UPI00029F7016